MTFTGVETGNKSYGFEPSTMAAKSRTKAREQARKGAKAAVEPEPDAEPF